MQKYYRGRIQHLPTSFIDTIDSLMPIIVDIDDVEAVILFGSCTKGVQTDNSNIDLLLAIIAKLKKWHTNRSIAVILIENNS